jgi:hypothetical protein
MTCVLLLFTRCVLIFRSIFVGALEVFFQWLDDPDKFDPRYLLFANWLCGRNTNERFKRWVLPPSNPPPMTDEENDLATERRLESPPRCDCRDRVVLCEDTAKYFVCPNNNYVSA